MWPACKEDLLLLVGSPQPGLSSGWRAAISLNPELTQLACTLPTSPPPAKGSEAAPAHKHVPSFQALPILLGVM